VALFQEGNILNERCLFLKKFNPEDVPLPPRIMKS